MRVISSEKLPIFLWLDYLEDEAEQQAKNLANLPFAFKHIAIMPDAHSGYGMPIGGVLATKRYIVPNAVGVDIGCGMSAVKTSFKIFDISKDILKKIIGEIRKVIPVGFGHHEKSQDQKYMPSTIHCKVEEMPIVSREYHSATKQLGTLGGGNHFIEIQKDTEDFVWFMIHSGSRNLGKKVADYYNEKAVSLNLIWHSSVPKSWELAYLPIDSQEGNNYIKEMKYCVNFALGNRQLMTDRIAEIFKTFFPEITFSLTINIAHNYAEMENHYGENVMVHRKGATKATEFTVGIIPGSQGSKSYIVQGKGNPKSFNSCSHGAGRRMSRSRAKAELSLDDEIKKLDGLGIIHGMRNISDLDEAPSAYKDIDDVILHQEDLIEIVEELTPVAVIKG